MNSNRSHSSMQLPPLKVHSRDKKESDLLLLPSKDINACSDSSLPSETLETQQYHETRVIELESSLPSLNLTEHESSSPVTNLEDSEVSPDVQNPRFNELSPRSEADFVLQEVLNVIKKAKQSENNASDVLADPIFVRISKTKLLDELTECARNQVTLLILRDCYVRLIEGNKFVEHLKCLCETEREFVKNIIRKEECKNVNSVSLDEDELMNLSEKLQMHSKHWFFVEGRLKSCEILHSLSELVNDQINHLKNKLNYLIYEALIRTQLLLNLIIKSLVLLDSDRNITKPKILWNGFVKLCEKYNDVCTKYALNDTSELLEHFSLERILKLVAKECAILGLDLFYNMLTEPLKQVDVSITNNVEWLAKNSTVYPNRTHFEPTLDYVGSSDMKNAKGEPQENDENQNGVVVMTEDGDLVTRLLMCVYGSSNLISTSLHFKNNGNIQKNVKEKCVYFESHVSQPFWMDFYVKILRKEILNGLELKWLSCSNEFGSVVFWRDSMVFAVAACAEELAQNADAYHVSDIYRNVAVSLKLRAALTAWDERLSNALPASLNHRFPQKLTSTNEVVTQAGYFLSSALEPLLSFFPTFQLKEEDNAWQLPQSVIIPCLCALLNLMQRWLANSTTQSLATWQLDVHLLITHSDLKRIVDLLKHISTINCPSFISSMTPSTPLSTRFYMFQMSELWEDVNKMSSEIQNIASSSIQKFYRKCCDMSSNAFATHMPVGKIWLKKYRANGPPNVHSEYIDNIIDDVLEPVLDGVKHLSMPVQISVVSMATKAFCESWMIFICKNKIKFSLHGALLFRLDVVHLSSWLRSMPELSIEAQQSIQALDVLRRLHGSSLLLTRQPRSCQRFRKTKVSPMSTIADLNLDATMTVEELSVDDSITDEDFVPNKDEWLALRAHRSSAGWHSLWCLSQHRE